MKLPDPQARAEILSTHLANLPEELQQVDVPHLTSATEGFTGADLKRLVEDGKAIYAYGKSRGMELLPTTHYFIRAIEAVKENKQHYAAAEAQTSSQKKSPLASWMSSFMPPDAFKSDGDDD